MKSLNKVTLMGNVGAAPDVRTTTNGGKVVTLSLATSQVWTDAEGRKQEKTQWHRCLVWNGKTSALADLAEKYVVKGARLFVEGRLEYRSWDDKDGVRRYTTEIIVHEIILIGDATKRAEAKAEREAATDECPF